MQFVPSAQFANFEPSASKTGGGQPRSSTQAGAPSPPRTSRPGTSSPCRIGLAHGPIHLAEPGPVISPVPPSASPFLRRIPQPSSRPCSTPVRPQPTCSWQHGNWELAHALPPSTRLRKRGSCLGFPSELHLRIMLSFGYPAQPRSSLNDRRRAGAARSTMWCTWIAGDATA